MDDTGRDPDGSAPTTAPMSRRAFFGRAMLAAGAATALFGLTGCPGGDQDDDDDEGDDD